MAKKIGKKKSVSFELGSYLKKLRTEKGAKLKDVEKATKISNVYLSLLETGKRNTLPKPDKLRALAEYFNVPPRVFMEKAGYLGIDDAGPKSEGEIVNEKYQKAISDPKVDQGARVKGDYDLEMKKLVIELYEKATGKKL